MLVTFKSQLQKEIEQALRAAFSAQNDIPPVELEIPSDKSHGEFSSNIALKSSKIFKKSPLELADAFVAAIEDHFSQVGLSSKIQRIEIKKPGFINFYLSPQVLFDTLSKVFEQTSEYGKLDLGNHKKVQIEFVSANPTGPLSVAHARQAAVGDALGNILNFVGFDVTKEYYVNDEGNQINILGRSIHLRALEILGESVDFPEEGYQGKYIKDMAQIFLDQNKIETISDLEAQDSNVVMQFGVDYLLDVIKKDLDDFGVYFNAWSHQSKIATQTNIEAIVDYLGEKGFLYEKDGALWFKSTDFDDDKDRVIEKSDGSYTYLTPDIVYHKDKYDREFDLILNIWGPDHHGYIPRIKAAIEALGQDRESLEVLIVQLATIYRDGKPISMSTRRGQYISLREVIDEVGVDVARFFFLMRHIKAHLEFDLELAKKESPENPVYYIQYAHARIHSINDKALASNISLKESNFSLLKEEAELDLIKKIGLFSESLRNCYQQFDPFPLVSYLQELAACFHRFYDCHRVVDENQELSSERLGLVNAVKIVIANGLTLLGMSVPKKM